MPTFTTLHESLSFDTQTKIHKTRAAAELHMATVLIKDGEWPREEAIKAAKKGTPVLVLDNGDDETIQIQEL